MTHTLFNIPKSFLTRFIQIPSIYAFLHGRLHSGKVKPFVIYNDVERIASVVDLGCGPGINACLFTRSRYLGIDIDPKNIELAKKKHVGKFEVANIIDWKCQKGDFDCFFVHSVLHHLTDSEVFTFFQNLQLSMNSNSTMHLIDLILPEYLSLSKLSARLDPGGFPRTEKHWKDLIKEFFDIEIFELFDLRVLGIPIWSLFYFRGKSLDCNKA